jgi:hypothetical protein
VPGDTRSASHIPFFYVTGTTDALSDANGFCGLADPDLESFDMPTRHEISCINKSDRPNPHERITHVGGRNPDGTWWKLTQQAAIQDIQSGNRSFFVRQGVSAVDVVVAVSRFGHYYLKTQADGEMPDNLLSLPECR